MSTPTVMEVGGRATRVRLDGDDAAPTIVLLHGLGRSLEDWSPVIPTLTTAYRVISLDLPGFGFSARRPERATLTSFALGVLETLDELGQTRPIHVIGNSLGAGVALQLQAIAPDRIASLVLVDGVGFGVEVTAMLRLITVPVLGRLATLPATALTAKLSERMSLADPSLATTARIEHALEISKQPDPRIVMREAAQLLGTARGVRPEWRQALFSTVALNPRPTLVVWGERDRVLPAKHLNAVRKLLPHAETHLFTGVGHMPQIECPGDFADIVLGHLAKVANSRNP